MNKITDIETITALLDDYKVKCVEVEYDFSNSQILDENDLHSTLHLQRELNLISRAIQDYGVCIKSFKPIYHEDKEIGVGDVVWCKEFGKGEVITDDWSSDFGNNFFVESRKGASGCFQLSDLTLIKEASEL